MTEDKNTKALQDDELSEVSGGTGPYTFNNTLMTDQITYRTTNAMMSDSTEVNTVDLMHRQGAQGQQVGNPVTGRLKGVKNSSGAQNGTANNNSQPLFNQSSMKC